MIFEISQNIARKVFEKVITDIDNYLRKNRERGKLKNTGKREKYFLTRFGDILYLRTRYKDKKTGKSCYLLDKKPHWTSPALKKEGWAGVYREPWLS